MTAVPSDTGGAALRQAWWQRFRRYPSGNIMLIYGVMLFICIVIGLANPEGFQFLHERNLAALLTQMPRLMILSVAVGILMITGEFDLSIGAVYVLAPYLMGMALERLAWPLWAALGVAILAGLTVGAINGVVTTRLKLLRSSPRLYDVLRAGCRSPCRWQRLFGGQGAGGPSRGDVQGNPRG